MPGSEKKKTGAGNAKELVKNSASTGAKRTGSAGKKEPAPSHRSAASAQSGRGKTAQGSASQKKSGVGTSTAKSNAQKPAAVKSAGKKADTFAPNEKKRGEAKSAPTGKKTTRPSAPEKRSSAKGSTAGKSGRASGAKEKKTSAAKSRTVHKGKSRSRAKLLNILPYVLMTAAFIGVMVILSLTVFFKVENLKIKIDGDIPYSSEEIINASPVKTGQNIFSGSIKEAGAAIEEALPYIEHCEAVRKMPDTVVISIVGAKPAGILTLSDKSRIIVSSTGKILEVLAPESYAVSGSDIAQETLSASDLSATDASATDKPTGSFMLNDGEMLSVHSKYLDETSLTLIEGLNVTGGKVGMPVETDDETAYATLEAIVGLLEQYSLSATQINLAPGNLYVEYENRMSIRLGSGSQLEEKMEIAADIILNRLTKYDSGQVDVSNPQKAYYTPAYIMG